MSLELWLAFTLACILLTLVPGPSVLLVISQSIMRGRDAAFMCIVGDVVGGVVLMGLSFVGVGAILAASAVLFQLVKWAGVIFLAYLGITQILEAKNDGQDFSFDAGASSNWASFWAGALTAILNPKAIVFYMAFLSQFVDPGSPFGPQVVILITTSSVVVAFLLAGYALIAARARKMLQSNLARRRMGYTGGTLMIGGSAIVAVTR